MTTACNDDWHEIIRPNLAVFIRETYTPQRGQWQDTGDGDALLVRCCSRCTSLISDGTLRNGGKYPREEEEVRRVA